MKYPYCLINYYKTTQKIENTKTIFDSSIFVNNQLYELNRFQSEVYDKYKNNDEDYEIVLEKYIKKSSTQSLVDFYLVNTKTLEVTDQQRDYW